MRNKKGLIGIVFVFLLVLFVLVGILIGLQISDSPFTGYVISGGGDVVSEKFDVSGFDEVEILGKGNLFLRQGIGFDVVVEAEREMIDLLDVRVEGDRLVVGNKKFVFFSVKPINVYVTMPEVEGVSVSGSGSIEAQNRIRAEKLDVSISGSGDVEMELNVGELRTKIFGSGDVHYTGFAEEHDISISGSGDVRAFELISENVNAVISGSGDIDVYVSEDLDVTVRGSGDVRYKGSPDVSQSVSGSGKVGRV